MNQIFKEAKERMESQQSKVLDLLQSNKDGVLNIELNKISLRFGSIIYNLKLEGYDIETVNIKDGVVNYILKDTPKVKKVHKKGIEIVQENIQDEEFMKTLKEILDANGLHIIHRPNALNKKSS